MKIAIDFDGTIVEHRYPEIGREQIFAFETLRQLQKKGHQLILWTFRSGTYLDAAVEYCRQNGIEFYAVNASYPGEIMDDTISRKPDVDMFIDDRNFGGFPGWSEIWEQIGDLKTWKPDDPLQVLMREVRSLPFKEKLKMLF